MIILKIALMLTALINAINAMIYFKNNATSLFNFFKEKYHKAYKNSTYEENALKNFVKNLNNINALNEKSHDSDTLLVLNKNADLDTENVEEHYALNIISYDNDTLHRGPPLPADTLRNRIDIKPEDDNSVEEDYLYDLNDADNIYKNYMKYFKKKNATKKYDETVRYYRFIKTLVQLNREHYKGNEKRILDENADVVKKPFEYVY